MVVPFHPARCIRPELFRNDGLRERERRNSVRHGGVRPGARDRGDVSQVRPDPARPPRRGDPCRGRRRPAMSNTAVTVGAILSVLLAAVLVGVTVAARRGQTNATDFYLAGRKLGAGTNALALFASFTLFSTLFTMVGHIALNGFDAFIFAAGFAVSFLISMFLFAGPLRAIRGYTIGDLFALRADQTTARKASLVVTLLLYATYTIVMMNAIGIVASV